MWEGAPWLGLSSADHAKSVLHVRSVLSRRGAASESFLPQRIGELALLPRDQPSLTELSVHPITLRGWSRHLALIIFLFRKPRDDSVLTLP